MPVFLSFVCVYFKLIDEKLVWELGCKSAAGVERGSEK